MFQSGQQMVEGLTRRQFGAAIQVAHYPHHRAVLKQTQVPFEPQVHGHSTILGKNIGIPSFLHHGRTH